jgi:hypothetical protein
MASLYQIPEGVGHPIINPFGRVIILEQKAVRTLDIKGYLHRDKITGLKGMDPTQSSVFIEAERGTNLFYYIGEDFSGPNSVVCDCDTCKGKIVDEKDILITDIRTRQANRP